MNVETYRDFCQRKLLAAARRYGRLKAFGVLIEDGSVVRPCPADAENLAGFTLKEMGELAVNLVMAMGVDERKDGMLEE